MEMLMNILQEIDCSVKIFFISQFRGWSITSLLLDSTRNRLLMLILLLVLLFIIMLALHAII